MANGTETNLDVKIGSAEEAAWQKIKDNTLNEIGICKRSLILLEHDLKKIDEMLEKEKL